MATKRVDVAKQFKRLYPSTRIIINAITNEPVHDDILHYRVYREKDRVVKLYEKNFPIFTTIVISTETSVYHLQQVPVI